MDKKGQGALEYLLLIGGAVLIAAIVIAVLTSLGTGAKNNISTAQTGLETKTNDLQNISEYP